MHSPRLERPVTLKRATKHHSSNVVRPIRGRTQRPVEGSPQPSVNAVALSIAIAKQSTSQSCTNSLLKYYRIHKIPAFSKMEESYSIPQNNRSTGHDSVMMSDSNIKDCQVGASMVPLVATAPCLDATLSPSILLAFLIGNYPWCNLVQTWCEVCYWFSF